MIIESPQNEKLKLVRKLRERKHREREGLFVTEGEDLLEAGLAAGRRAALRADRRRQRARRRGGRAGAARRGLDARLRARGRSRSGRSAGRTPPSAALRLPARRRRPRQRRRDRAHRARAARRHASCSGPAAPTRTRRRRCGRAWARSSPSRRRAPAIEETPAPRAALVAHGGEGLEALAGARDALPRRRARGTARRRCSSACEARVTIPLRPGGAESLNVAAAAAIAVQRISSRRHAGGQRQMLERIEEIKSEAAAAIERRGGTARAGGAAGPLPRPQSRADRRSCAASPSLPAGGARQGRQRRQPGPQGARGAARARARPTLDAAELEARLAEDGST